MIKTAATLAIIVIAAWFVFSNHAAQGDAPDKETLLSTDNVYQVGFGSEENNSADAFWEIPKRADLEYELHGSAIELRASIAGPAHLYVTSSTSIPVEAGAWYRLKIEGFTDFSLNSLLVVTNFHDETRLQIETLDTRSKEMVFRTSAQANNIKLSMRLAGAGKSTLSRISLDRLGEPQRMLWPADASRVVSEIRARSQEASSRLQLLMPPPFNSDYVSAADKFMEHDVIDVKSFGSFALDPEYHWADESNNSIKRFLHGHFIIHDLVHAYIDAGDQQYLDKAVDFAAAWTRANPYVDAVAGSMSWHDETTARRLMAWVFLLDVGKQVLSDSQIEFLTEQSLAHAELLSSRDFHTKFNNHGMFQDQALLMYGDFFLMLSESGMHRLRAINRLNEYFTHIISEEGVHLEHSPSYHQEIARSIKLYADYFNAGNDAEGERMQHIYAQMSRYATHLIKPDRFLPQIGDTPKERANKSLWSHSEYYRYAVTAGREGKVPPETDAVFPESGYAIFRDQWQKDGRGLYLFFNAAYHGTGHKHNDDLSLWLYKDRDIIVESGPYGYKHSMAFTKYGFSSFSHNTLIVDGEGLVHFPNLDRKYSSTYMRDYKREAGTSQVVGVNERYDGVRHTRKVALSRENGHVTIEDEIASVSNHDYKLLWHIAPGLTTQIEGSVVSILEEGEPIMEVHFVESSGRELNIREVKGQTEPFMLGWYFINFYDSNPTPISVLTVDVEGESVTISTKFIPLR